MNNQAQLEARKQGIAGVFSRAASTYDQIGPHFFAYFGRKLVEVTPVQAGARVLDVATGRGAVLFPLAEKVGPAGQVIGIDLADEMVQITGAELKERGIGQAQVLRMDAEQLEFEEAAFDAVFCGFGVSFFPQLSQALSEIYRVLKPGGLLAVSLWGAGDERWDWFVEVGLRPAPQGNGHHKMHEGKADWLEAALQQAGFTGVQTLAEQADFSFASPDEWWATEWSHGARGCLERLDPAKLEQAKNAAFARLEAMRQPDGIHHLYRAFFLIAQKPAN